MSFGELLALLMSWAGRRLRVGIATAADPPVMVAMIAGRLTGGEELSDGGVGAVAFAFADADADAAFVVAPESFESAGWHERDRATLVVRLGAVKLWIEQETDQRRRAGTRETTP